MEMKPTKRNLRSAVTSMNQTSLAWLVLAAQSTESSVKFLVVSYNISVWEDVFTPEQWTPKGINGNSHIAGPKSRSEGDKKGSTLVSRMTPSFVMIQLGTTMLVV